MVEAIKDIVSQQELLNKRYSSLLLTYFTSLTSFNFHRFDEISECLGSFLTVLSKTPSEQSLKFGVDYLSFISNLSFRNYLTDNSDEKTKLDNLNSVNFCMNFINELVSARNIKINFEVLRIYENLIDKNGYEIPAIFWRVILDKTQLILNEVEEQEIGSEMSKMGELKSASHHAENCV